MGQFLIDEDDALKQKLSGLSVPNYSDGRNIQVPVYFRFPDPEVQDRKFPHIAIDLVEIAFDPTRAHRSGVHFPGGMNLINQATPVYGFIPVADDYPLPWKLVYQLAAYSRQPRHDRALTSWLIGLFPEQFGILDMTVQDGTVRRADLISIVRRDTIDATNKRLYRNIFTVAVSSERYVHEIQLAQEITKVVVTGHPYVNMQIPASV